MAKRTKGADLLQSWLRANDVRAVDVGRAVGASRQAVYQWIAGDNRPDATKRDALARYSRGAVPAPAWETDRERRAREAAAAVAPYDAAGER